MQKEPSKSDDLALLALKSPKQLAIVEDSVHTAPHSRIWNWETFIQNRNQVANVLREEFKIQLGERIVIYGHNSYHWVLLVTVANLLGLGYVPMNWHCVADEIGYIIDDSDSSFVFFDEAFLDVVKNLTSSPSKFPKVKHWIMINQSKSTVPNSHGISDGFPVLESFLSRGSTLYPPTVIRPDGLVGSLLYSGGTTGRPKGIIRTGKKQNPFGTETLKELGIIDPAHINIVLAPLYHSAPLAWLSFSLGFGYPTIILDKFNAERAWYLIHQFKTTMTFVPPILLKKLVGVPSSILDKYNLKSMKSVVVAGAPCPVQVKKDALRIFGPYVYEFYGSSELNVNTIVKPEDLMRKPLSCGKPAPGIHIVILDENGKPVEKGKPGILYVKNFGGELEAYHKAPEKLAKMYIGEYATVGDVAYMDEENYVYICDRVIDMIISGGANIYPAEIEQVLHQHPSIADVAVFGIPDEEYGEKVHASIELKSGAKKLTAKEVQEFCEGRIARFKIPKDIAFLEQLPRTPSGKLLKRQLRDHYWKGGKLPHMISKL